VSEDKIHQSSHVDYQIRIDGVAKYYPQRLDKNSLKAFIKLCEKNPNCYVDIARVNTEIVMSQYDYHQMKRHFKEVKSNE